MTEITGTVVDEGHQQGFDPRARAREDLARAMMEVEMHKLQDVLDLVASDLTFHEPRAGAGDDGIAVSRRALARQALRLQGAPDTGVGRTRHDRIEGGQEHAQVVVMQLRRPPGMRRILRAQGLLRLKADAWETADVAPDLIAQHGHRVGGVAGGVVPSLNGGGAKAHLKSGQGMAPAASGERA